MDRLRISVAVPLEPAWVGDLLGLWATSDLAAERGRLGFGSVSPMFARMGEAESVDTDQSYSSAEVAALVAAVDRLQAEQPAEWLAVQRRFRPWTKVGSASPDVLETVAASQVLRDACARLAAWVDEAMEG